MIQISKGLTIYDARCPSGLRWFIPSKHHPQRVGTAVGQKSKGGYWRTRYKGVTKVTSHIIWEYFYPEDIIGEDEQLDHIDGNTDNNNIFNLRKVKSPDNNRNKRKMKNNTSGVTGVKTVFNKDTGLSYWVASWNGKGKGRSSKYFSINKLGEEAAFEMAVTLRITMLQELNSNGDTYTERHGK